MSPISVSGVGRLAAQNAGRFVQSRFDWANGVSSRVVWAGVDRRSRLCNSDRMAALPAGIQTPLGRSPWMLVSPSRILQRRLLNHTFFNRSVRIGFYL
ncbi:hypothetical protein [Roseiconus lacunae]|uniref:Uncharacterized protein n=1 Tax=Roseiconus lacunae TaxID=2605694 RepID=A0ABT7PJ95_9BACT|nr:hypothetical protein [Roseiconus lacunae]MDM4016261.1 hypothetical protein [Roseiconus lacunae]